MFRLTCTALVGAALALPVAPQKPLVFDIDMSQTSFTFGGTMTIPGVGKQPILGLPRNTFVPVGSLDFDVQTAGSTITNGRFAAGATEVAIPRLSAQVPDPSAPGYPLAQFTVNLVAVQFTSPPFTVSGGSFSTQVTATMLRGYISGAVQGTPISINLPGTQSSPVPVTGSFAHGASGFSLNAPLSATFPFSDAGTGITADLVITGTAVAADVALSRDTDTISLPAGGQQSLTLSAGTTHAGLVYLVLGSVAGTSPGINFGGGVVLPLNFDGWMETSILFANGALFVNTAAMLDAAGVGSAAIAFPPLNIPALFGLEFDHAYLVISGSSVVLASNYVPLELTS